MTPETLAPAAPLNLKTILGLKLKRFREARRFTLRELGERTGLSTSYLAEIEAGKKYPKLDKILQMAEGLGCPYEELVSTKLDAEFDTLHAFLTSPAIHNFPFDLFGLRTGELMKLITRSPHEVSALLRTLHDIASQYNIGATHFLRAALRSYQELTGNYYAPLEDAADRFRRELAGQAGGVATIGRLRAWVLAHGVQDIDERLLGERPALRAFRSLRLVDPPRLLLNPRLSAFQQAFVLAREAGYQLLELKARSQTTPPDREDSFEQVLNDFKASYFAGAVLLPRDRIAADLGAFFRLPTWQPAALTALLDRYGVTPETLMYRFSQLTGQEFGLHPHFLKFSLESGRVRLLKQLNLSTLRIPSGIDADEHYCRRWLSTHLLMERAAAKARRPRRVPKLLVRAQHSTFVDRPDEAFFCLGMALAEPLRPELDISLTIGFRADEVFARTVRFAQDRAIRQTVLNGTCEHCPLPADACGDRAAAPVLYQQQLARAELMRELEALSAPRLSATSARRR
ncbi:MAG: ImmA/IrrE family metallo-endopeptidase [Acidobacteriota bacterium]|nr:ImmA/IrrE family metallo-endopeptidase [Acidobacteriota bacterium]